MADKLPEHHPMTRGSMAIAAFSTVVEWYDFTLYLYFATVLSRIFFGEDAGSLLTTLATFAVAYLMRPLGALAFGHIGDRHGRRRMMLLSVAIMTAAMFLTALLPARSAIGPLAGYLLLVLRCVMGFSVGGEYTGVVAYLLEGAPAGRRGLITSLASAASEVGALLAVAVCALTTSLMSNAELEAWGWRLPFFVGAALAGSVWIARSVMQESPDFERQRAQQTVPARPLRHVLALHRRGVIQGFTISALGSITYYVGITYTPAFLTTAGGYGESAALWIATAAAVIVIVVTPLTGIASDRWGRRPVLVGLAICGVLLPVPMFWLMADGSPPQVLLGAGILAAVAGGVSAVGAVTTAELLPGEGRLTGLALGATSATAIFGGLTPYLAHLLVGGTGMPMVPGIMIAIVAAGVLPILLTMRETAPARQIR